MKGFTWWPSCLVKKIFRIWYVYWSNSNKLRESLKVDFSLSSWALSIVNSSPLWRMQVLGWLETEMIGETSLRLNALNVRAGRRRVWVLFLWLTFDPFLFYSFYRYSAQRRIIWGTRNKRDNVEPVEELLRKPKTKMVANARSSLVRPRCEIVFTCWLFAPRVMYLLVFLHVSWVRWGQNTRKKRLVWCCANFVGGARIVRRRGDAGRRANLKDSNRKVAIYMTAIVTAVLGISYAAVPLYKVFCQVSEYNVFDRRFSYNPLPFNLVHVKQVRTHGRRLRIQHYKDINYSTWYSKKSHIMCGRVRWLVDIWWRDVWTRTRWFVTCALATSGGFDSPVISWHTINYS